MSYAYDQNPWQEQNGPRYGNAYEDNSTGNYGNAYEQPQMNMPMPGFSATGYNNAWTESNKTEYDSVPPQNVTPHNAYQYSGTPYGNQPQNTGGAYSNIPAETIPTEPNKANNESTSPPTNEKHRSSNQGRFWLSLITLLASIGHLGFAAGARPYSNQDVPFSTSACFYYLWAVAILSIVYSLFHTLLYFYRAIVTNYKTSRPMLFAFDLIFALLWGVGLIVEAVKYKCWWGGRFCDFYNVSLFWGFLAFACYIFAIVWNMFDSCRRK
ncbi:unnamed protein product [Rhizopus microsporus]